MIEILVTVTISLFCLWLSMVLTSLIWSLICEMLNDTRRFWRNWK